MNCPKCGNEVVARGTKFGKVWQCCGLRSWSETREMVDNDTRAARRAAHRSFDALWKTGRISRREAYKRLASVLNLDEEQCHMGMMTVEVAKRVPKAARKIICDLRRENRYKSKNLKKQSIERRLPLDD